MSQLKNVRLPTISFNNQTIDFVKHYSYLGVRLDNQLNYEAQVKETQRIVMHKLYVFAKIRKFINRNEALTIFK